MLLRHQTEAPQPNKEHNQKKQNITLPTLERENQEFPLKTLPSSSSGSFSYRQSPPGQATRRMTPNCCVKGTSYDIYQCSLPVYGQTRAQQTLNSFQCGGNGGGAASCEGHFLSDDTPVVALSTRWFDHKRRCNRNITIRGNGHRTMATVVDKCDAEHDYQSSCWRNIVNASKAVWRDLGVPRQKWGELGITWSDA